MKVQPKKLGKQPLTKWQLHEQAKIRFRKRWQSAPRGRCMTCKKKLKGISSRMCRTCWSVRGKQIIAAMRPADRPPRPRKLEPEQKCPGCGKSKSKMAKTCYRCSNRMLSLRTRFGERVPRHLRFDHGTAAIQALFLLNPEYDVAGENSFNCFLDEVAELMMRAKASVFGGGGVAYSGRLFVIYRAAADDFAIYVLTCFVLPGMSRLVGPNPESQSFKRRWGTWFNYQIEQASKKVDSLTTEG